MRLVEAEFPEAYCERIKKYAELAEAEYWRVSDPDSNGICVLRAVFKGGQAQALVDALQSLLESETNWRLIVLPVEAMAPRLQGLSQRERRCKPEEIRHS